MDFAFDEAVETKKCNRCRGTGAIQVAQGPSGIITCPKCDGTGKVQVQGKDSTLATDPPVSRQQQKMMCAVAHGSSTHSDIPKSVGEEFCGKVQKDAALSDFRPGDRVQYGRVSGTVSSVSRPTMQYPSGQVTVRTDSGSVVSVSPHGLSKGDRIQKDAGKIQPKATRRLDDLRREPWKAPQKNKVDNIRANQRAAMSTENEGSAASHNYTTRPRANDVESSIVGALNENHEARARDAGSGFSVQVENCMSQSRKMVHIGNTVAATAWKRAAEYYKVGDDVRARQFEREAVQAERDWDKD